MQHGTHGCGSEVLVAVGSVVYPQGLSSDDGMQMAPWLVTATDGTNIHGSARGELYGGSQ